MEKLNEKLWPIVKEYTRQTAKLLDCDEWHWIGTNDDGVRPANVCDFGSIMFLTLEDMQVIIDRLDEWVKRYGSTEAVAQEIRDWFDWWLNDKSTTPHPLEELVWNRFQLYMTVRPSINLENWLSGCPREPRKPTIDDELRLLICQRDMVKQLIEKYRDARTLWNIFDNLSAEIKSKRSIKDKLDEKLQQDMKHTDAYKNFEQAMKEHSEHGGEF